LKLNLRKKTSNFYNMQNLSGDNYSLFVTAHDASRISKTIKKAPNEFLTIYPADIESKYSKLKIKGRDYLLGIDHSHENLKFWINDKGNEEIKEYNRIVEVWNRNFGNEGSFLDFLNFVIDEVEK
jgi:hypothetical protein